YSLNLSQKSSVLCVCLLDMAEDRWLESDPAHYKYVCFYTAIFDKLTFAFPFTFPSLPHIFIKIHVPCLVLAGSLGIAGSLFFFLHTLKRIGMIKTI
ncbi:MAG: hypothetical protein ACM31H_05780, partial [Nitrososphaerales archaeon]